MVNMDISTQNFSQHVREWTEQCWISPTLPQDNFLPHSFLLWHDSRHSLPRPFIPNCGPCQDQHGVLCPRRRPRYVCPLLAPHSDSNLASSSMTKNTRNKKFQIPSEIKYCSARFYHLFWNTFLDYWLCICQKGEMVSKSTTVLWKAVQKYSIVCRNGILVVKCKCRNGRRTEERV